MSPSFLQLGGPRVSARDAPDRLICNQSGDRADRQAQQVARCLLPIAGHSATRPQEAFLVPHPQNTRTEKQLPSQLT